MPKNSGFNLLETAGDFTFTAIPNFFLDAVAPTLNPSELRVMLYIYRHTLGFQKLTDTISYDQFLHGMVTQNGRTLDKGAGVSRNSLVAALASLENKTLIERRHNGKYGPVSIRLLPAALYDPAGTTPDNPSTKNRVSSKKAEECGKDGGPVKTLPVTAENLELTGQSEDQLLDRQRLPGGLSRFNQAQVLTENRDCEAQKLDPTKKPGIKKQNKPDRIMAAQLAQGSKLIASSVPGISSTDATRLVEQAVANGRNQEYISRLVQHVTTNPAIRVPAAVLTTLIKSNEDRLLPGNLPLQTTGSTGQYASDFPTGKGFKNGRAIPGKRPLASKKIDFEKYTRISSGVPCDPTLTTSGSVPDNLSSPAISGVTQESSNSIDPHLKHSLHDFDSRIAVYVRHLKVEGSLLKIGFFGTKRPLETELNAWLPGVRIFYPQVRTVKIIDSL